MGACKSKNNIVKPRDVNDASEEQSNHKVRTEISDDAKTPGGPIGEDNSNNVNKMKG